MEQEFSATSLRDNQSVYDSFEKSMHGASIMRLLRATHVISELRDRKHLLQYVPGNVNPEAIETEREDSTAWETISIDRESLQTSGDKETLIEQYMVATYLRALRLVTDFLENDRQIPVSSPEQNLNRALNRLLLLEQLENYKSETYA